MVSEQDRAVAELLLDPGKARDFDLLPAALAGTECAVIAHVELDASGELIVRPALVILNGDLFARLVLHVDGRDITEIPPGDPNG